MIICFRYVDGERIHCCRICKYVSKDFKRCNKVKREFEHHGECPPFWCPGKRGME